MNSGACTAVHSKAFWSHLCMTVSDGQQPKQEHVKFCSAEACVCY